MLIETAYQPWRLARAVNQTSSSFVAKLATSTEPVTAATASATSVSILEIGKPFALTQNAMMVLPFGTGSDGNTFSLRVFGWAPGAYSTSGLTSWYPTLLCELLCTLSSTNTGVASGFDPNGASDYFAKTITITYGNANVSVEAVSPAVAGLNAHAMVSAKGFQKFELTFSTGSSATDCNALCRFL